METFIYSLLHIITVIRSGSNYYSTAECYQYYLTFHRLVPGGINTEKLSMAATG
jgi:hypothetical protein